MGRGVVCVLVLVIGVVPTLGEEVWVTRDGTTTLTIYNGFLSERGVTVGATAEEASSDAPMSKLELRVDGRADITFAIDDNDLVEVFGGRVELAEGLTIVTETGEAVVTTLVFAPPSSIAWWTGQGDDERPDVGSGCLLLRGAKAGFNAWTRELVIAVRETIIPAALADELAAPELADTRLGSAHLVLEAEWIDGDEPEAIVDRPVAGDPEGRAGPDVTLCQVYNLRQWGRIGSTVGLASAGTSWNVGGAELDWFASPNPAHPFIVYNMYRLKDDRFEQIGQSWIKHGFCALDNSQCDTSCAFPTGCSTLNVGCTDTYSSSRNGTPGWLAPRYELDPWNGAWTYAGSHFSGGSHSHTALEHRIQVKDADLDPAQNAGATYYYDQIYICHDDIDAMNNSGWKPCTPIGAPGGTWSFTQTSSGTPPTIGFAVDAWTGATTTILAEVVPPIEFVSPDGRCILKSKATDLGGGVWHYEYALFNVDMDRQVDSFSVPITPGMNVSNVGFYAVAHHDEPVNTVDPDAVLINNVPWTASVTSSEVSWSTTSNPLRWGVMYNFWFDAEALPADTVTVTAGLFRPPGTPDSVSGDAWGPSTVAGPDGFRRGDFLANGSVDVADAVQLAKYVSYGTPIPSCPDAADTDDNGGIDLVDAVYVMTYMFTGGPPPPAPGASACGGDTVADALPDCAYDQGLCSTPLPQSPAEGAYELSVAAPAQVDGAPGGTVQFGATVRLSATVGDLAAFSIGVTTSDPANCSIVAVSPSTGLNGMNGGSGPDFFGGTVTPGVGAVAGGLFSFDGSETIGVADTPYDLVELTVEASLPLTGCATCTLQLVDDTVGTPTVDNLLVTSAGAGLTPNLVVANVDACADATPECAAAVDCADLDLNGITDDVCVWWECVGNSCVSTPKSVPADLGGSFGACPIDTFCNIHDVNHTLTCFSGESACESINADGGGPFGSCTQDGFCNIHDANHARTCFSGTNVCSCPSSPLPTTAPTVVGEATLSAVPASRVVRAGGEIAVRVLLERPVDFLQSYQLHLAASGGRSGELELVDAAIEAHDHAVLAAGAGRFEAFNVENGQMLAGLYEVGVGAATDADGYLATFTYRATPDAVGVFVVDVLHDESAGDQTFLIAPLAEKIAISETKPAVITVIRSPSASPR